MEQLSQWEILKSFEVIFKEEKISVDLVRIQVTAAPELFFFVTMAAGKMLIHKKPLRDKLLWIGGSVVSFEELQELGSEIERQLGYPLPLKESNNPFTYTGDIDISITGFMLGNLPAEKAKAPYSSSMWYRIYLPETTVVMVNMDMRGIGVGWSWILEEPTNFNRENFERLTKLIDLHEKKKEDNA